MAGEPRLTGGRWSARKVCPVPTGLMPAGVTAVTVGGPCVPAGRGTTRFVAPPGWGGTGVGRPFTIHVVTARPPLGPGTQDTVTSCGPGVTVTAGAWGGTTPMFP